MVCYFTRKHVHCIFGCDVHVCTHARVSTGGALERFLLLSSHCFYGRRRRNRNRVGRANLFIIVNRYRLRLREEKNVCSKSSQQSVRISICVHLSLVSRGMRGRKRDNVSHCVCDRRARVTRGRVHMRSHAFHIYTIKPDPVIPRGSQ